MVAAVQRVAEEESSLTPRTSWCGRNDTKNKARRCLAAAGCAVRLASGQQVLELSCMYSGPVQLTQGLIKLSTRNSTWLVHTSCWLFVVTCQGHMAAAQSAPSDSSPEPCLAYLCLLLVPETSRYGSIILLLPIEGRQSERPSESQRCRSPFLAIRRTTTYLLPRPSPARIALHPVAVAAAAPPPCLAAAAAFCLGARIPAVSGARCKQSYDGG